ncbi:MAG TPA: C25 family cysteine peptidase, partial [Candidatus Cloacimonadota bacterium]|nr:C25 family cysteine peptidase [Candidatus Cloacimonadota bacterium]
MKKLALLLMLGLLCGLAVATSAEYALTSYKTAFEVISQTSRQMELSFTLPEYEVLEEIQGNAVYHKINLPGAGTLMQSGMPDLPVITTTIAIPHQGGVNIEVLSSEQSYLSQFNAYPLQQGQELESPKAFIKNEAFYSSTENYPSAALEYSDPVILRDFRLVTIQINPFSYNASTQELTVHQNIQLRVNYTNEPGINELAAPVSRISPSFDKIYSALIQNYDDYRDAMFANTPPRYLIIHGNTTDNTFLTALDSYVLWKRQKGADVTVANTSSGQAGSSTSSIQTYIRNQYNNPETRPDYVILIGDTAGSFTIPAFTNNSGGSDYPFTFMNTGDMLGDVFIGRISVENVTQFLVVLNKIYLYERDLDLDTASWLNHLLLVGDNAPSGISTMYISKYIKEMAQEVNPDATFTEAYGSEFSAFVNTINAAFNQGIGIYSYRGYIDFSPPSESSIFNGFKLPHAVTITCATGNYSGGTGETEQMLRYGSTAAPKGTVTAIGMSTSSTHTTFNNVLHGGIFDGIYAHGMRSMGEAMLHGKLYMYDIFGVSSPLNVEKFTHWCNLMGDPTMEVYTGIPNHFQMTTYPNIPLGLTLLDVAVTDGENLPVDGASVVLSLGDAILSRGYTDAEGNVVLILPATMTAGTAKLTVSKHNFKPLQSDIEIVDVDTLVPAAIIVDDDTVGASNGNGDGIATAGETLEIYFGLLNTGSTTISGITGTVTSDSPWISITQGNISYPDILGESSGNNLSPIVIEVAPNTPHDTLLRLHLNLSDNAGNDYVVSELVEVQAAMIEFVELNVVDGAEEVLDPGETANLSLSFINNGQADIINAYAR